MLQSVKKCIVKFDIANHDITVKIDVNKVEVIKVGIVVGGGGLSLCYCLNCRIHLDRDSKKSVLRIVTHN